MISKWCFKLLFLAAILQVVDHNSKSLALPIPKSLDGVSDLDIKASTLFGDSLKPVPEAALF